MKSYNLFKSKSTKGIKINECIILGTKNDNGDIILAKNRDRKYIPKVAIDRELIGDIEIAIIHDLITDWMEGMNSAGIGIVNTALTVGFDEKEEKIVKKTGKKSDDGDRIKKALSFTNIDDVVDSLINYNDGIKGHTLVSDGESIYTIEMTSVHEASISKKNPKNNIVRTNHGMAYTSSGYTEGDPYLSSILRRSQVLDNIEDYDGDGDFDIFDVMSKSKFIKNSPNHVVRDTEEMNTTSQMYMNINKLEFNFRPIKNKCKFVGIRNFIKDKNYKPKIKINIEKPFEIKK